MIQGFHDNPHHYLPQSCRHLKARCVSVLFSLATLLHSSSVIFCSLVYIFIYIFLCVLICISFFFLLLSFNFFSLSFSVCICMCVFFSYHLSIFLSVYYFFFLLLSFNFFSLSFSEKIKRK